MNEENKILIHLKTLSCQQDNEGWPYSVHPDYFHSFTANIQKRIASKGDPSFTLINAAEEIPGFSGNEFKSIKDEVFEMPIISKEQVYKVDERYFDDFYQRISAKLNDKQPAQLRKMQKSWWAAAAILIAIIVLSTIYFVQKSTYRQNIQALNFAEQKIGQMPTDQLTVFLNPIDSNFATKNQPFEVNSEKKPVDFSQLFKKISDKDLRRFLDETALEEDDFLLN